MPGQSDRSEPLEAIAKAVIPAAAESRTARGSIKSNLFDLTFDGELVARSVQVPGLSTSYQLAVMARTDAIGNEYSVTVDNFKVYRAKGKKK